jgi:hypothetical protein
LPAPAPSKYFTCSDRAAFRVFLNSGAPGGGVLPHFCQDCVKLQKIRASALWKKAFEFRQIKGLDI